MPFDSARIQICREALKEHKGNQYIQMSWNLLSEVKAKIVFRVDVDFQI